MQLTIHLTENNARSQAQLDEYREQFSNDCWKVLQHLLTGNELTVRGAMIANLSGHLPRRIKDLTENGIHIQSVMAVPPWGGRPIAYYSMDSGEIARVKQLIQ
jgi:hypothetical protein